jgi:hypothetical protein
MQHIATVGMGKPPPEHDVVAKCPNGKKRLPTASIHVVIRVNLQGIDTDADVIAYSYDSDFGSKFVEQIASTEVFGRFWNYEKNGSPCFDPLNDDGSEKPMPKGKFMMWDLDSLEETVDDQGMPVKPCPTLIIFDGETPIRKYKVALAPITVQDLVSIETEGDKFFN